MKARQRQRAAERSQEKHAKSRSANIGTTQEAVENMEHELDHPPEKDPLELELSNTAELGETRISRRTSRSEMLHAATHHRAFANDDVGERSTDGGHGESPTNQHSSANESLYNPNDERQSQPRPKKKRISSRIKPKPSNCKSCFGRGTSLMSKHKAGDTDDEEPLPTMRVGSSRAIVPGTPSPLDAIVPAICSARPPSMRPSRAISHIHAGGLRPISRTNGVIHWGY